jgi:hypothetical protein
MWNVCPHTTWHATFRHTLYVHCPHSHIYFILLPWIFVLICARDSHNQKICLKFHKTNIIWKWEHISPPNQPLAQCTIKGRASYPPKVLCWVISDLSDNLEIRSKLNKSKLSDCYSAYGHCPLECYIFHTEVLSNCHLYTGTFFPVPTTAHRGYECSYVLVKW